MMDRNETQQRICRACNQIYTYPVVKSAATRFYCAACMNLKPGVRATFELYNKRIKALTEQVEQLTNKVRS